jgi:hypothetical protein
MNTKQKEGREQSRVRLRLHQNDQYHDISNLRPYEYLCFDVTDHKIINFLFWYFANNKATTTTQGKERIDNKLLVKEITFFFEIMRHY